MPPSTRRAKMGSPTTPEQFVEAYSELGSVKAVARRHGMSWWRTRKLYLQAVAEGLMDRQPPGRKTRQQSKRPEPRFSGRIYARQAVEWGLPPRGEFRRYLFTCAQNNTHVHPELLRNLRVFAEHVGASIHVARFTYIKSGLGASGDKARWVRKEDSIGKNVRELWWDAELEPYLLDDRVKVAPGLTFCGEINILPTAERPLSGLLNYTGRDSAIFPHVKVAMESVPSAKREAAKLCYTTGAVTVRNYIQRKAGLKGEFHHVFGALLVEVDSAGSWFCRQVNAENSGTFYDLDVKVEDGRVTTGHRVEAVCWGDVHVADLDPVAASLSWGEGGMLDHLRPRYQFFHDVLDFRSRSHHETRDPHRTYLKHVSRVEDVRREVERVSDFLKASARPWCRSVVVDSNHHNHLGRWLRDEDGRRDPVNAQFWLDCGSACYREISLGRLPNYLRVALDVVGFEDRQVSVLEEDESFLVCPDHGGGVECGHHGHAGPNGARGNPRNMSRMGRKMNLGHLHSATVHDGVYVAGVCCRLDPYWTSGPSSWSHSQIVVYNNGKRCVVTYWDGCWAAGRGYPKDI